MCGIPVGPGIDGVLDKSVFRKNHLATKQKILRWRDIDAHRKYTNEYRANNREKANAWYRDMYHKDVEHSRARKRACTAANPEMYNGHQRRSRKRNRPNVREWERVNKNRRRASGSLSSAEWNEMLKEHGYCLHCGDTTSPLSMDHWTPVAKGGGTSADNIVPACLNCNKRKGAKTIHEWLGAN